MAETMNAFFELKGKIESGQKNFGIHLIERLVAEHEAMRKENARLRENVTIEIEGKVYEIGRDYIAPAPLDVSDDEVLFFEPVPVMVLKEKS